MGKPVLLVSKTHADDFFDKRYRDVGLTWHDGEPFGVIMGHQNEQWNYDILDILRNEKIIYDPGYEPGDGATVVKGNREEVLEKLKKHFEVLD